MPYLHPDAYDVWGFGRYHERIGAISREAALALIDLRDDLVGSDLVGREIDPIHPNPAGHELIARRLQEELSRRGMLSPRW